MADKIIRSITSDQSSPKKNLGSWQHADRIFISDNFKHSPKFKFLYHVKFYLNDEAFIFLPELKEFNNEIGLMVKNASLPTYTAEVETKHKYNRKKNIQTKIEYNSVDITFHDDNFGITSALLEAYYKFYFADGRYDSGVNQSAFGTGDFDSPYTSEQLSSFRYGLDSGNRKSFFRKIEISQMNRGYYTTYSLINPLITDWDHGDVDYSDDSATAENSITIKYESVFYERGKISSGGEGNPSGFAKVENYDQEPSSISDSPALEKKPNITNTKTITSGPTDFGGIADLASTPEVGGPTDFGGIADLANTPAVGGPTNFASAALTTPAVGGPTDFGGIADLANTPAVGGPTNFASIADQGQSSGILGSIGNTVGDVASGIGNTVGDVASGVGSAIDTVDSVADSVGSVVDTVSGVAETAAGAAKTVTGTVDAAAGLVGADFPITDKINEATESVTSGLKNASEVVDTVRNVTSQASTAVTSAGEVVESVTGAVDSIGDTVSEFSNSGGTIISGAKEAISQPVETAQSIGDTVGDTVSGITDAAGSFFDGENNPKATKDSAFDKVKKDIQLSEGLNDINSIRESFDQAVDGVDTANETADSLAGKVRSRLS